MMTNYWLSTLGPVHNKGIRISIRYYDNEVSKLGLKLSLRFLDI